MQLTIIIMCANDLFIDLFVCLFVYLFFVCLYIHIIAIINFI